MAQTSASTVQGGSSSAAPEALSPAPLSPLHRASWIASTLLFIGSLVLGFYGFVQLYSKVPWVDQNSFLMQGDQLLKSDQYDAAMQEYETALHIDRSNFFAFYKHGFAAFLAKKPEVALASFQEAVARNPTCADCYHRIALILLNLNRQSEALGAFEAAAKHGPDKPAILNDYGIALAQSGKLPEAATILRRAVELDPDNAAARQNLATLDQMMGGRR